MMENLHQTISAWVESHRDSYLRDVSRLVAIRSVTGEPKEGMPFGEGPAAALEEAMRICEEHGLIVKNHEGYVMTADVSGEKTALDILAHLDVVGEGEGWNTDPYEATEIDGCLYGRGTDDDKGPAVAAIYAMQCARELFPLQSNVRLILGTDEESGSKDIEYYYGKENSAPYTFSPDASFPVYNTEKGGLVGNFQKKWQAETALPRVAWFEGGYRINVLPSDARALVLGLSRAEAEPIAQKIAAELGGTLSVHEAEGGVMLAFRGVSAHASTPEEGLNGITALIRILLALPLAENESRNALNALSRLMPHGESDGKSVGIAMQDAESGALTLAFSLLSMNEKGVHGAFDSRVPICATEENCRVRAKKAFEACGFSFKGKQRPPHHTPAEIGFVQSMLNRYEEFSGRTGECLAMGGGTYVHEIEGGVAFGAGMPDFVSNLHSANERMNIADMLTAIKIFAAVIYDLCK